MTRSTHVAAWGRDLAAWGRDLPAADRGTDGADRGTDAAGRGTSAGRGVALSAPRRASARWAVAVISWLVAPVAWAYPGDHIRTGDLEIAPDVDIGAEYRSNVFRADADPTPAANFRIAPGVRIVAAGDDHEFGATGEWELRKYFFVGENGAPLVTTQDQVGNLDRFDEFQIGAGADTFKRSVVGFRLSENAQLQNVRADAEFARIPYLSQFRNSLGGGVRINPGPALEIVPGAAWTYDAYQRPTVEEMNRNLNRRNAYGPTLGTKWAFLPRTSLVGEASFMHNDWTQNVLQVQVDQVGETILVPNSNEIKGMAGVDGRFTAKLMAQLLVGYGTAEFNEQTVGAAGGADVAVDVTGLDGLLVQSQLRYLLSPDEGPSEGSSITAGYVRDFHSSFFTNFVQLDQLFADVHARIAQVEPSVRYELRWEDYQGGDNRNDTVHRVVGDVRLSASDWASFTTGAWYQKRLSTDPQVQYDDFNLHVLATFAY